jgi:hypothetical protein
MRTRSTQAATAKKPKNQPEKKPPQASKPVKPQKTSVTPEAPEPQLVRLHDLSGLVVLHIPPQLREILGEELYQQFIQDVEQLTATLIHRDIKNVVYIHMPVLVREIKTQDPAPLHVESLELKRQRQKSAPPAGKKRSRA